MRGDGPGSSGKGDVGANGMGRPGQGGPRAGFRAIGFGKCATLNADGQEKPLAGAVISLWLPNDTALIGSKLNILPNGSVASESLKNFRFMTKRMKEGDKYYPNGGMTESDS
ncbi:MAG: hypothetical protein RL003_1046, partial [Bacteroidota bacterium]